MSTEQASGVAVSDPLAVKVMRELAGSRRYCSFSGRCRERTSITPPKVCYPFSSCIVGGPHPHVVRDNLMDELFTTRGPSAPAQPEALKLPSGTRFGRYDILGSLGAGGMGEVYRARDTRLGRDLAIKVLSTSLTADPQDLDRFEREACSASALNHPNIVTIFELGQVDSTYYIAME